MKKLKLFFACLLMAVLSIGQVWGATLTKVSAGDLVSGQDYLITATYSNAEYLLEAKTFAAKGSGLLPLTEANYGNVWHFTKSDNVWTIALSTGEGLYFTNANDGVACAADKGAAFTIAATAENATTCYLTASDGTNTRYLALYYASSTATNWRCYKSTSTGVPAIQIYKVEGSSSTETKCVTPTFSVAEGTFYESSIEVELSCTTTDAVIHYTLDGSAPTASSATYSAALEVSATTTIKAIAVKEGLTDSDVASATYTKGEGVSGYTVNFESDLVAYVDWEFSNLTKTNETITGHGSSTYYAKTNATNEALATTKVKIATPGVVTYYVSKLGTNTNANSYWYVEVSSDGSEWTKVGEDKAAAVGITQGTWTEYTADLSEYTDVYVRVHYKGTTAVRTIDDIELAMASDIAKPSINGADNFLTSSEISMACTTEGADIYYTLDGTDPKSGTKYTAAFSIEETKTIKAIAKLGDDWSDAVVATFTKATVMTVAQARAAIDAGGDLTNKFVAGTISQIDSYNSTYNSITYWISDDGTTTDQLQVYSGLAGVVKAQFESVNDLAVGDDVTVKGTLKKYNSTYEFDYNNTIEAYKPIARLAWSAESFDAALEGENTFPSLTNTNGVTVSYSSSDPTKASFADASVYEITLNAAGSTTITATFAGNETYKANSVSYTLNVASSLVTLTYNVDGGEAIGPVNVSALPNPLPTTTKAGKNFGGWFTDPEKTVDAVAGASISENTTLYAKWLDPYTVAEALAMIDAMENNAVAENSIYVTGKVCVAPDAAPNSGRLTYFISADGDPASDQFQIYLGYGVDGENFTAQTDVQVEDVVVAYGKLKKYVKSNVVYPEFDKGSQLYSLSRKADAELAWSEASFDAFIGETNTFPTLTNDHNVAVTYSSTETDYATISNEEGHEGEITLVAVGTTTIKATFAGDEDYKAAEVSYTLNVYNPITAGTITYEENGGSEVADVETPVDNLPDPLPTPTKENNIFAGWWTTSTFDAGTQAAAGAPMNGDITLYAKWIEIPYYAKVYTSNVGFVGGGDSHETNSKVSIAETEYDAQKVGSSSKGGTITVTVPAKTNTLHFHVFTWKNKSNQITVSGALTNLSASTIDVDGDDAGGGSGTYTIESNPVDHYHVITFDAVEAETEITFTSPASGEQRFIMYGINQEGGVYPVLDHIVITGEATELTYEIGDEFNPAGLGVNAIYTLEEVEQTPVAVDVADIEWSFDPAHIAGETTSVTVTASYTDGEIKKTANKTVTGITVNVPAPEILVNPASVAFGNVNQNDVVEAEVINVTLKSVENATIALSGDVAAFTLDKDALTANGTISVTPVTSVAGTFAATITISDDASAAESKEVALSMTVKAPEIPDVCDGADDFITATNTSASSYNVERTTTDGWHSVNSALTTIEEEARWLTMLGKTSQVGAITSPTLNDGIASLKIRYANTFNESNGVSFRVDIKQGEDVVKTYTVTKANADVEKGTVYTELIENINVAGDFQIVITNLSPSNADSNKDRVSIGRLCWSSYTAPEPPTPAYTDIRTGLTAGNYFTVCWPKEMTAIKGATLWSFAGKDDNMVYLIQEEAPFEAGKPFIAYATSEKLEAVVEGDDAAAGSNNGLYGTLSYMDADALAAAGATYMLKSNALRPIGTNNHLDANRAYVILDNITGGKPSNVPAHKVRSMPMQKDQAQGIEDVQGDNVQSTKVLINGNLYILRGEKVFDATGRLVK